MLTWVMACGGVGIVLGWISGVYEIKSWTSFQNDCISGHSHYVWSREPKAELHLQHSGEMLGKNLWILSGILYHLE